MAWLSLFTHVIVHVLAAAIAARADGSGTVDQDLPVLGSNQYIPLKTPAQVLAMHGAVWQAS